MTATVHTVRNVARVALPVLALALALSACLPPAPPVTRVLTYSVTTDGPVTTNPELLASTADWVYHDLRGWRAAGIEFRRVPTGGDFSLVLAHASTLPSYDPVCSVLWSCQVGRYVVINETRFVHGSPNWAGPLDWYQVMVINHETGHFLRRGHSNCPGAGEQAPVMQQQSISLQGCVINPWPLPWEIDAVRR